MIFWTAFVGIAVTLSAAGGDFIPENERPEGSQGCECVPRHLCNTTDIRIDIKTCSEAFEVCCAKIRQKEPSVPHSSDENQFNKCGYPVHTCSDCHGIGNENNEAKNVELPWVVSISALLDGAKDEKNGGNHSAESTHVYQCGGSIIHPSVILTGAHCVDGKISSYLKVCAGEWGNQTFKEPSNHQDRQVSYIVKHEDFDNKTMKNDVALLFLSEPIHPAENVGFACLPPKGILPDPGTKCLVSCRGNDSIGEIHGILKNLQLLIIENEKCQNTLSKTTLGNQFRLHNSFICADAENGTDVSKENGGSPLVCPIDTDNPGRYIQSGLLARIIESKEIDTPGVFVNLANFRNWIDSKLKENNMETSYYSY